MRCFACVTPHLCVTLIGQNPATYHQATGKGTIMATLAGCAKLRDRGLPPPPVPGDHSTLYDHPYAAYYLGKSAYWVRRKVSTGEIPPDLVTRIGQSVTFTGDQLVRLIAHFAGVAPIPFTPRTHRRRASGAHRASA